MSEKFSEFVRIVPKEDFSKAKIYMFNNMAIFEPETYVIGRTLCMDDYQFIIHFTTPPPTKIGKTEYQFKKGSLSYIERQTEITVLPAEKIQNVKYISICVTKDFFETIAFEAVGKREIKLKKIEFPYSNRLIESINNFKYEYTNFGTNCPSMLQSISTQVVFQLIRDICSLNCTKKEKNLKDINYVKKAIEYMQSYYNCNASIDDISRLVYLSSNYFIRIFKEQTGQTPHEYLIKIRIEKAKEMLKKDEYSIEAIAGLCGFVNAGHFSTLFKKAEGISPSDYRKHSQSMSILCK